MQTLLKNSPWYVAGLVHFGYIDPIIMVRPAAKLYAQMSAKDVQRWQY
ncbi:MAG: hypothetical protein WBM35_03385 [Candidatus Electrothrix sp.]